MMKKYDIQFNFFSNQISICFYLHYFKNCVVCHVIVKWRCLKAPSFSLIKKDWCDNFPRLKPKRQVKPVAWRRSIGLTPLVRANILILCQIHFLIYLYLTFCCLIKRDLLANQSRTTRGPKLKMMESPGCYSGQNVGLGSTSTSLELRVPLTATTTWAFTCCVSITSCLSCSHRIAH